METPPILWHSFFFLLFAVLACAFAVAVVVAQNVVRMAFFLVISLGATAGLFFLAGADMVGAMQLMIYVGGTLVLLIFGVMLTAQQPFISMRTPSGEWILAAIVGGSLLVVLLQTAFSVESWRQGPPMPEAAYTATEPGSPASAEVQEDPRLEQPQTATRLGFGLLGQRVDQLEIENPEERAGMSGYLLPFEIVSVHLLVVLIGAAYLARARHSVSE